MFKSCLLIAGVCLATLFTNSANARDVIPDENLGTLIVKLPEEFVSAKMQLPSVAFKPDGLPSQILTLGKENKVQAGRGCLNVESSFPFEYEAQQCGIEIKPKGRVEIQLSGLMVDVNREKIDVDLGPQLMARFTTSEYSSGMAFSMGKNVVATSIPKGMIVLPEMSLDLSLANDQTPYSYTQSFSLHAGSVNHDSINPPDERASIQLELVDGASKFKTIRYNYMMAAYGNLKLPPTYISRAPYLSWTEKSGRHIAINDAFDSFINYYKFSDNLLQTIKAYPLIDGAKTRYTLIVNEHEVHLPLKAKETLRVPVATVDVFSFKSKREGKFYLFSNRDKADKLAIVPTVDNGTNGTVREQMYSNESSLYLPFGYKYRFDFYANDDFGHNALQDQVELDLTKE